MILKKRVVIYDCTKTKMTFEQFMNGSDAGFTFYFKVEQNGEPTTYFEIPKNVKTPRDLEYFILGIQWANKNMKVERADYEY